MKGSTVFNPSVTLEYLNNEMSRKKFMKLNITLLTSNARVETFHIYEHIINCPGMKLCSSRAGDINYSQLQHICIRILLQDDRKLIITHCPNRYCASTK